MGNKYDLEDATRELATLSLRSLSLEDRVFLAGHFLEMLMASVEPEELAGFEFQIRREWIWRFAPPDAGEE